MTSSALRPRDLARRVTLVAAALDDLNLSLGVDTDGHVSVCILDPADRARAADRLGLTEHKTSWNPLLNRASGSSSGVWCDIPVTLHGLDDRGGPHDATASASLPVSLSAWLERVPCYFREPHQVYVATCRDCGWTNTQHTRVILDQPYVGLAQQHRRACPAMAVTP